MPVKPRQPGRHQKPAASTSASSSHSLPKSKSAPQPPAPVPEAPQYPDPNAYLPPSLASLRRDWRWAAVSQFLYTFQGPLRIDPYIEVELEEDLAYGMDTTLSRIVHRLLFTLAQDRKITPKNWMGYLQGQYARRISPRPNPFYQDMMPPPRPEQDAGSTKSEEPENTRATSVVEAPAGEGEVQAKSTDELGLDPTAQPAPDASAPPGPDASAQPALDGSDTPALEGSARSAPSGSAPPEAPAPAVALPPMRQWSDLTQSEQLDVLWTLCEWQFTGAMRLRTLLGEEDSGVGWRMEPVGWDAKKNTYWLIGETRLWIQHHIHRPKLPPKKKERGPRTVVVPLEPGISSRAVPSFESEDEGAAQKRQNGSRVKDESESDLSEADEPNGKAVEANGGRKKKRGADEGANGSRKRVRVGGTRISLRLRGNNNDDDEKPQAEDKDEEEEQEKAEGSSGAGAKGAPMDDPFGSDSDLTEVDELEREIEEERKMRKKVEEAAKKRRGGRRKAPGTKAVKEKSKVVEVGPVEQDERDEQEEESGAGAEDKRGQLPVRLHMAPLVDPMLPPPLPPGFIEWETICATLQDWEAFPARFEKSTHPNEKSFRSFLNKVLVPTVTTSLRAQLKVKKLETAVQNRKRSSRIAIKESIVEAQRQEENRRTEEMELHARARRVEERERRAQEDMLRREREREEKVRSREARAGRRGVWDGETTESGSASPAPDGGAGDPPVKIRLRPGRSVGAGTMTPVSAEASSGSGTSSRTDESWELLCEGCGKQGWNIDDGSQLVKCETCGRWSHTTCHDRADELAGNPKRDWSAVDFTCRACSNTARRPASIPNGVPKQNGSVNANTKPSVPGVPAPAAPAYMYTSFQAVPNGHITPQPLPYPGRVFTDRSQPPVPTFAPFIQHPPAPVPVPPFQMPIAPYPQQAPMYPSPYPNGHPGL